MPNQQPVCGFAGGAGRAEDGSIIFLQNLQPSAQIVSMPHGRDDAERCTQEGRSQLRDKFLSSVVLAAKSILEIAPQARLMAGGMTQLMQDCPIPVDRVEKAIGEGTCTKSADGT
jgi:hypothetical protein